MARSSVSKPANEPAERARFRDPLLTIADFGGHFLVECPRCGACARVERGRDERPRLTCKKRGFSEIRGDEGAPSMIIGGPFDMHFQLPLWLATPCCGECLWAYNERHLDFLEAYVAAKLRERSRVVSPDTAQRNQTLVSRLPTWLKLARNRAEILSAIAQLRERK